MHHTTPLRTVPPANRRSARAMIGAGMAAASLLTACGSGVTSSPEPYASWTASPSDYNAVPTTTGTPQAVATFNNTTLHHTMQTALAGDRVRVRLSKVFGKLPLCSAGARVARTVDATSIDSASDTRLTFAAQAAHCVPAGAETWSDPVSLRLGANTDLAVSVFVATLTAAATYHALGRQTTYVARGNQLAAAAIGSGTTLQSYH